MDVKEIHLITTDIIKSLDCCFRGSKTTETKLLFSKKAIWQIILTINFVLHIKEDDTQSGNPILCGFFNFARNSGCSNSSFGFPISANSP